MRRLHHRQRQRLATPRQTQPPTKPKTLLSNRRHRKRLPPLDLGSAQNNHASHSYSNHNLSPQKNQRTLPGNRRRHSHHKRQTNPLATSACLAARKMGHPQATPRRRRNLEPIPLPPRLGRRNQSYHLPIHHRWKSSAHHRRRRGILRTQRLDSMAMDKT